ncbi:MAG: ABC transporter ATP-binding protein [Armatimonadota bacterium]|nr:ABC transporter ATP-binding protein [Armatimonadota bacterium]
MAEIRLESLHKRFGRVVAVRDVSLEIREGEFVVLLGPSGCGKTTVLRLIAGLETPDRGRVWIGGRDVTRLPPGRRHLGMVFQSYALFPHMRVFDNVAFGLRMRGVGAAEQRRRVQEVAELLQIADLLDRYPAQLSGGQRQRVAVARALVVRPQVLLMDEPLSNLDALLRLHMRAELKRLHREVGSTTVYVTHDQVEAMSLGDRVAVLREGQVVQFDTPTQIYDHPADRFVGSFLGNPPMNFFQATVDPEDGSLRVEGVKFPAPAAYAEALAERRGGSVLVGIRPEHVSVGAGPLRGEVLVVEPLGPQKLLTVRTAHHVVKVAVGPDRALRGGDPVTLGLPEAHLRLMDAHTERALPRR